MEHILFIIIKISAIMFLLIYLGIAVLIARQTFLMNKAITTKLAGLVNCLTWVHVGFIAGILVLVFFL